MHTRTHTRTHAQAQTGTYANVGAGLEQRSHEIHTLQQHGIVQRRVAVRVIADVNVGVQL